MATNFCGSAVRGTKQRAKNGYQPNHARAWCVLGFIDRMDLAYQAADLIASRAGAMSIAELALVGKPAILVPSPHVAEDHQTHNARSLTELGGAVC